MSAQISYPNPDNTIRKLKEKIARLEGKLEQTTQPFIWLRVKRGWWGCMSFVQAEPNTKGAIPVYLAPPAKGQE